MVTRAQLKIFFSISKKLMLNVKAMYLDLYIYFINAKKVFGKKAHVVIDCFHIAELYRNGFASQ